MDVAEYLKDLPKMGKAALCQQWQELFNQPAPAGIRTELMIRMLAFRIQEQSLRGLNPKTRRRLDQMAAAFSKDPKAALANMARVTPGTQLVRSWNGKTHTVTAEESGYLYQSRRYRSLSEIARHITGTRWSGPLFFGLKTRKAKMEGVSNAG
jgi:hypothetical protein